MGHAMGGHDCKLHLPSTYLLCSNSVCAHLRKSGDICLFGAVSTTFVSMATTTSLPSFSLANTIVTLPSARPLLKTGKSGLHAKQ